MPDQPNDGEAHFPDAWSNGVAKVLLNAMFPPFKGYLLPIA